MGNSVNINPPKNAMVICRALRDSGFESYLVGGCVRDSIMGREPNDWDIATNARPEYVTGLFLKVVETGLAHGTVTVIIDGESFEVTTYRIDGDYSDGRRPDSVEFSDSITTDLSRRDFTINAIAHDPIRLVTVDPFGGLYDIASGTIRAVGIADERFQEDTLRTLRAVRFAAALGFSIETETFAAIQRTRLSVSNERVMVELVKGLACDVPSRFMTMLLETGILEQILPEMLPMVGCGQNKYHEFDVWRHTLSVLDHSPNHTFLRLAAMLHDISKPTVKGTHPKTGEATFYDHENIGANVANSILRRLKFSNEVRETVVHLIRHHLVPVLKSPPSVRRWVRKVGIENVPVIVALARADCAGKGTPKTVGTPMSYLDELEKNIDSMRRDGPIVTSSNQLAITGNDVMSALGIGPGPGVGRRLRELLELVTDHPEMNERDTLLSILRNGLDTQ